MPEVDQLQLSICQMTVSGDKRLNIAKAGEMIRAAASSGSRLVVLPEMFNCPYDRDCFAAYAEPAGSGETFSMLSETARQNNVTIVGGSIPEYCEESGRIYNTSPVIAPDGNIIARHRKIHMFDVDLEEGLRFHESDVLSPGDSITVTDTEVGKIGVAICYDIRFPELVRLMTLKGAQMVVVPAAFNLITGPAHWHMTMRSRAVDNQVFLIAASPARDENAKYVAFGHSMAVDPWGDIVAEAGSGEVILTANLNLSKIAAVRDQLPLIRHRRTDIYDLSHVT